MTPLLAVLADQLPPLVDRRRLLRLGFSAKTVDHVWRRVALVQVTGDTKTYARREDVLAVMVEIPT
jgi:hypothetical protein